MISLNRIINFILKRTVSEPKAVANEVSAVREPIAIPEIRELTSLLLSKNTRHFQDIEFEEPLKSNAINSTLEVDGKQIKISYLTKMPGSYENTEFIPDKYFVRTGRNPISSDSILELLTSSKEEDIEAVKLINEIVANVFNQASDITGATISGVTFAKLNEEGALNSNPIYCSSSFISGIYREVAERGTLPISFDYIYENAMTLRSILIHEMSHAVRKSKGIGIDFIDFPEVDYALMKEIYNRDSTTAEQRKQIDRLMRKENADEFPVVAIEFIHTLDCSSSTLERFNEYFDYSFSERNQYLYNAAVYNSFKLVRSALLSSDCCKNKPRNSSPEELIKSFKSIPEEAREQLIKSLTKEWLATSIKGLYEKCKNLPEEKF